MTVSLARFPDTYDRNIAVQIMDGIASIPKNWKNYFNVDSASLPTTTTSAISGFGASPEWPDGEPISVDSPSEGADSTVVQKPYGLAFKVTRRMMFYDQNRVVQGLIRALVKSVDQCYAVKHADILNNAFTTTYTSLSSKALIAADHPAAGGQTRSNILASSALTPANLETLIVQGMNAVDYRGKFAPINYTKLIVPAALRRTALKILGSTNESGTMDNDINVHRDSMTPIIEPALSASDTAWFLQADFHYLTSLHALAPLLDSFSENSTKSWFYRVEFEYGVGIQGSYDGHVGIAGSQGA